MPHLTAQITVGGPMLDIRIGVSDARAHALRKSGQPVPPPVPIRGLIDTGASSSAVDPSVLTALGIPPTGTISVLTPSTGNQPHTCEQYDVEMVLVHPDLSLRMAALPVIGSVLANQGFHALLGRDILEKCLFVYNG